MATTIDNVCPFVPVPALAHLSRQCMIFTNGPSLTLKTTLAEYLGGGRLQVSVRATHQSGTVLTDGELDDQKRLGRYGPLFVAARRTPPGCCRVLKDPRAGPMPRRTARPRHFACSFVRIGEGEKTQADTVCHRQLRETHDRIGLVVWGERRALHGRAEAPTVGAPSYLSSSERRVRPTYGLGFALSSSRLTRFSSYGRFASIRSSMSCRLKNDSRSPSQTAMTSPRAASDGLVVSPR